MNKARRRDKTQGQPVGQDTKGLTREPIVIPGRVGSPLTTGLVRHLGSVPNTPTGQQYKRETNNPTNNWHIRTGSGESYDY